MNNILNCGDIVFQGWSGRFGVIIESIANTNGVDSKQQQFGWHARVLWFSKNIDNIYPLGQDYALSKSLNLISKA